MGESGARQRRALIAVPACASGDESRVRITIPRSASEVTVPHFPDQIASRFPVIQANAPYASVMGKSPGFFPLYSTLDLF